MQSGSTSIEVILIVLWISLSSFPVSHYFYLVSTSIYFQTSIKWPNIYVNLFSLGPKAISIFIMSLGNEYHFFFVYYNISVIQFTGILQCKQGIRKVDHFVSF
jgi:hypothetical protein